MEIIIAAIILFIWDYFKRGITTPEQRYWSESAREARENYEKQQQEYQKLIHPDKK